MNRTSDYTIKISPQLKCNFLNQLQSYDPLFREIPDISVHGVVAENCLRDSFGGDASCIEKLEKFGTGDGHDFLVIKNLLDVTEIPPTPIDDKLPHTDGWYHVIASLIGMSSIAGMQAGSLLNEKKGRLCHVVAPAKADEECLKRTTKPLHYHTEIVNGKMSEEGEGEFGDLVSPDVIILGCLRNPHMIGTTVLPVDVLLNNLPYNVIRQLQKPEYTATSQSSVEIYSKIHNVPILVPTKNGKMAMRYSRSKISAQNERAQSALNILTKFLDDDDFGLTIDIEPGDVLLISNRTCVHRRIAIKNTSLFDGKDRWLLRVYGFRQESWRQTKRLADRRHVISSDL